MKEPRTEQGKFAPKSTAERKVRSIRATDRTWDDFGFEADKRRITRADLLEMWTSEPPAPPTATSAANLEDVISVLEQALTMKANAGGAIKAEIRKALELLT
jgi:hypothetical protein